MRTTIRNHDRAIYEPRANGFDYFSEIIPPYVRLDGAYYLAYRNLSREPEEVMDRLRLYDFVGEDVDDEEDEDNEGD